MAHLFLQGTNVFSFSIQCYNNSYKTLFLQMHSHIHIHSSYSYCFVVCSVPKPSELILAVYYLQRQHANANETCRTALEHLHWPLLKSVDLHWLPSPARFLLWIFLGSSGLQLCLVKRIPGSTSNHRSRHSTSVRHPLGFALIPPSLDSVLWLHSVHCSMSSLCRVCSC